MVFITQLIMCLLSLFYLYILGFLEREIKRDRIPMLDSGDNPDAPLPREMIDLEVKQFCVHRERYHYTFIIIFLQ